MPSGGIYTLVLSLDRDVEIEVGALGLICFSSGHYAYTGSARSASGFKRIERHLQILSGEKSVRKWHIDYLLPLGSLCCIFMTVTSMDLECEIARRIGSAARPIPHFGCSDCQCISHLHYSQDRAAILDAVDAAHEAAMAASLIEPA